jgi:hypothetical protein
MLGSCCWSPDASAEDVIGIPAIKDGVQEITVTVTGQGYSPATQAGFCGIGC